MTDRLVVLATDHVASEGLGPLEDERFDLRVESSGSDSFERVLASAQALVVRSATNVDDELMGRGAGLRVIGRAGVGVDNIDVQAATNRGIAVFNAPGGNTIAAAEMTMALILSVVRRVAEADRSVRRGDWDRAALKGRELKGKTLGLLGAGRIGTEVALRCQAFGMSTIAFDPYLPQGRADEIGVSLVEMDDVIEQADIISLHVPLNDETRGMVSADMLNRMKSSAYIVNVSRGGVIDEGALAAALESGSIAGAGLDVYESEPLPADSSLRTAPNLVLTPHLGASTAEAQVNVAEEVSRSIRAALLDGDVGGAVNASQLQS